MLIRIQNDLFDLGADLCIPSSEQKSCTNKLRIVEKQTKRLESEIDSLNAQLEPLKSFILPGGNNILTAYLHLARTVSRRAERLIVKVASHEYINPEIIKYINRLSDHMFVLSRYCESKEEVLWNPGLNR